MDMRGNVFMSLSLWGEQCQLTHRLHTAFELLSDTWKVERHEHVYIQLS